MHSFQIPPGRLPRNPSEPLPPQTPNPFILLSPLLPELLASLPFWKSNPSVMFVLSRLHLDNLEWSAVSSLAIFYTHTRYSQSCE